MDRGTAQLTTRLWFVPSRRFAKSGEQGFVAGSACPPGTNGSRTVRRRGRLRDRKSACDGPSRLQVFFSNRRSFLGGFPDGASTRIR
jgi:hypothetical protein